jgi:hypothetical protein
VEPRKEERKKKKTVNQAFYLQVLEHLWQHIYHKGTNCNGWASGFCIMTLHLTT